MNASTKQASVSRGRLPTGAGLATAGMGSAPGWLSFRRIVDIPFDACVAALESWRLQGHGSELHVGQSRLRGPIEHDPGSGTCDHQGAPRRPQAPPHQRGTQSPARRSGSPVSSAL